MSISIIYTSSFTFPPGEHQSLLQRNEEIGGPQWQFGVNAYDIDVQGSGNIATAYKKVSFFFTLCLQQKPYNCIAYKPCIFVYVGPN